MTKIFKSAILLLCAVGFLMSCSDDNDSNPILKSPTAFHLNTPGLATNGVYDLANSKSIELTCTQPDYGYPAITKYEVQVATKPDMSDAVSMPETYTTAKMQVNASVLASTLTSLALAGGKSDTDFPIDLAVYMRVKAVQQTADSHDIEGTQILSNIVTLNKVHLLFSLPPVTVPEELYLAGNFNNWKWDTALDMVPVNGTEGIFWHLVYIDGKGIKFNTAKAWDGNDIGFTKINIAAGSELGSEIINADGNIASKKPGWYLVVVESEVNGRNIVYNVTFNNPNVYLMGPVTASGSWTELQADALFTKPTTADGEFVSPAFSTDVPGGSGDGIRVYAKVPGYDWWKSEFMLFEGKIRYRGKGGDQDRVKGNAGQKLYLNFAKETGKIE